VVFSRGGSKETVTFSSVCLTTGGISLKESGVEATRVVCSSGVVNFGRAFMMVTEGIAL